MAPEGSIQLRITSPIETEGSSQHIREPKSPRPWSLNGRMNRVTGCRVPIWATSCRRSQPAVLAGPPRRNPADEGDLRVPPRLRGIDRVVGRPGEVLRTAAIEGGDVLIPGNDVVLVGMSERTSRQAITQVAAELLLRAPPKRSSSPACRSCVRRCTWTRCSPSPTVMW